jgi:indole-3-glycerol phosphate synthase
MDEFLKLIKEKKLVEIESLKQLEVFKRTKPVLDVKQSLINKPFIMEIKRSSPSKGVINENVNVVSQAKKYEEVGAGCISVLTEREYFKGSFNDLEQVSKTVKIPILCKDFIIHELQIEKAYESGADMILLIVRLLDEATLTRLYNKARELKLNVLFELHEQLEFEKVKHLEALFGVNSRDLNNFTIDKKKAAMVLKSIPPEYFKVAESGIESLEDIKMFKKAGANAFLIGTKLMQEKDLKKTVEDFYRGLKVDN